MIGHLNGRVILVCDGCYRREEGDVDRIPDGWTESVMLKETVGRTDGKPRNVPPIKGHLCPDCS